MNKILLLGGTSEANKLAKRLYEANFNAIYSYAGRTQNPAEQNLPTRIGGFGGVHGLIDYIQSENITHVIDATHPFAAQMSQNASEACVKFGLPLWRLERPVWKENVGENWRHFETIDQAKLAIEKTSSDLRFFAAIGRQNLIKFADLEQFILARIVDQAPADKFGLQNATFEIDKGPFDLEAEKTLLKKHRIDIVLSKNSGGDGAFAKIAAARDLGLQIWMIERPATSADVRFEDIDALMEALHKSAVLGE